MLRTRLQRVEKLIQSQVAQQQPRTTRGPGVATPERIRRLFDEIKRREAEGELLPPFDWESPSENPVVERIRLQVLAKRNAQRIGE